MRLGSAKVIEKLLQDSNKIDLRQYAGIKKTMKNYKGNKIVWEIAELINNHEKRIFRLEKKQKLSR